MFSENEIRNILFQVLTGLAFVHKHGEALTFVILFIFCLCHSFKGAVCSTLHENMLAL